MHKHAQTYRDNQPKRPATGLGFVSVAVCLALIYMTLVALGAADNSLLALMPR
jgi:hypothetical protein